MEEDHHLIVGVCRTLKRKDNIMKAHNHAINRVGWFARIFNILFAVFLSIFAFDVFSEGYSLWNTIVALFMHLLPVFFIVGVLLLSWRWELVGALVFPVLGLVYIISTAGRFHWSAYVLISGSLFLLGILYLISWIKGLEQK